MSDRWVSYSVSDDKVSLSRFQMSSYVGGYPALLGRGDEGDDALQAQHAVADSRQALAGVADADQDTAEFIIGLGDMILRPKLGEDGARHAIQFRGDLFDQVGTQFQHSVDERGERFDARADVHHAWSIFSATVSNACNCA